MNICAIILVGGKGKRMCSETPKQKMEILGKSILARTLTQFEKSELVGSCIVVSALSDIEFSKNESLAFSKVKKVVVGGESRAESARNGFLAIDFPCDYVLIHDGARCLVSVEDINAVIRDTVRFGAATASHPVTDTVKRVDSEAIISEGLLRSELCSVQTPQGFKYELYKKALSCVDLKDEGLTDDNSLMEKIGVKVYCTNTSRYNIKITYEDDLEYAKYLLTGGKIDV